MKIVSDSSCDINKELDDLNIIERVPLKIYLDRFEYLDDKTLNVDI